MRGVTIHRWPSDERLRTIAGGPDRAYQVLFSPDGGQLATIDVDGVTLSDPATSDPAQQLKTHEEKVGRFPGLVLSSVPPMALAFSPDGSVLAAAGTLILANRDLPFVSVWTTAPIALRATPVVNRPVILLALSHDGMWLATATIDGQIAVWEVASGERMWTVLGSAAGVTSLRFHPTVPLLASGDGDGRVALWTVGDDVPIKTLARHAVPVNALAFNASGDLLASGGEDGAIWLWGIPGGAAPG